jgi:dihydrolipoamide dehydrogenase
MTKYDVMVIGSGAGAIVAENALNHGLSVALVDKGPLGGTCLNLGCIPSKMLVYPADRIVEIEQAKKFGIHAEIRDIDFSAIMERMRTKVRSGEQHVRETIKLSDTLDFYEGEGSFVADSTLEVKGKKISAKKIFIAAGARPVIPEGLGLEGVGYLTNESVLGLKERPVSMIILGGGYIAAEYGHFFAAMGTKVTVLQRNKRLLPQEEPELGDLLLEEMRKRMDIITGTEVVRVRAVEGGCLATGKETLSGKTTEFPAQTILVVAGRRSNADLLRVDKTGVETDGRGFIKVDAYLRTNKENIWAFGDIIGKEMFRHVANREASAVFNNAVHGSKQKMDYSAAPHAVFTYPEIASVGLREEEAVAQYGPGSVLVGRADYSDVAMGDAMLEGAGFAKSIVNRKTGNILGFHIIGPYASILVQEVINAMASGGDIRMLALGMHIHPALPEVIQAAFSNLREVS